METLNEDRLQKTPRGSNVYGACGWSLERRETSCILFAPDDNIRVAVVDARSTAADAAVAEAWRIFDPHFQRTIKMVQTMPPRDGWDEAKNYGYELSPNERLMVSAIALRKGTEWTTLLILGGEADYERRIAQIRMLAAGVRPGGYIRETFKGKPAHPLDAGRIQKLTEFVERARGIGQIPGIALSLVQNGKIVFQGGFGVRELGKPDPVTPDTLFLIASNTKQFTTLLLAKLVDEGKFGWDTPVVEVYPAFKLGDAETTAKIQIRHLVSASTGLPRKDLEWLMNFKSSTAETVLGLLSKMQPTSKFGEVFQYSNVLGSAAGFVAGYALGLNKNLEAAFDEAMRIKIFEPLGMRNTTFDFSAALARDHAAPHSENVEGITEAAVMEINFAAVPMRPAIGLCAGPAFRT